MTTDERLTRASESLARGAGFFRGTPRQYFNPIEPDYGYGPAPGDPKVRAAVEEHRRAFEVETVAAQASAVTRFGAHPGLESMAPGYAYVAASQAAYGLRALERLAQMAEERSETTTTDWFYRGPGPEYWNGFARLARRAALVAVSADEALARGDLDAFVAEGNAYLRLAREWAGEPDSEAGVS